MHHDIGIVRQCGDKKDEKYARELERKEIESLRESLQVGRGSKSESGGCAPLPETLSPSMPSLILFSF